MRTHATQSGLARAAGAAVLALAFGCGGPQVVAPPEVVRLPGALGSASLPIVPGTAYRLVVRDGEATIAWVGLYGGGLQLAPVRDIHAGIPLAPAEWRLGDLYETPQAGDAALLVAHTPTRHRAALWTLAADGSAVTELATYADAPDAQFTWAARATEATGAGGYVVAVGVTGRDTVECRLPNNTVLTLEGLGPVESLSVTPADDDADAIAVVNEAGALRSTQTVWPEAGPVAQGAREFYVSGWMADPAREATATAAGCPGAGPEGSVRDDHGWTTACLHTAPDGAQYVNLAWELAEP